ncbi:Hypothetical predicted protein [Lecanosticta acicola]|uniref:Uncharacterized protein n=1 Tax=Lecanosticta acicola TaxID=111012 RepID=A0AAI8Z3G3_9PEZI|nr:Hypothetical predicted protein [Lecanosticta acicola]
MANSQHSTNEERRGFQFLELAPELRNAIYELSLVQYLRNKPRQRASSALLRTCKQVYKEARSILYQQSTLEMVLIFAATGIKYCKWRVRCKGFDSKPRCQTPTPTPTLLELRNLIPHHFLEIGTWDVHIALPSYTQQSSYESILPLNHLLHALACQYYKGKVFITLQSLSPLAEDVISCSDFFYPIAKFHPNVQLQLFGFETAVQDYIEILRNDVSAADVLQFDAVTEWRAKSQAILQYVFERSKTGVGQGEDLSRAKMMRDTRRDLACYVDGREVCCTFQGERSLKMAWDLALKLVEKDMGKEVGAQSVLNDTGNRASRP